VIVDNSVTPFTYTLASDCGGTRTVSNGPQFNIYAAFDGSAVTEIATAPEGFAVSAIARRTGQPPDQ